MYFKELTVISWYYSNKEWKISSNGILMGAVSTHAVK